MVAYFNLIPVGAQDQAPQRTGTGPPVDSTASCAKPDRHNPQSQSLPTLFYRPEAVCSPWRHAADIGKSLRFLQCQFTGK
jgi:hypothetical protein